MKILEILRAGISSSIQDEGRFGSRSYAIPQSGCLDKWSQHLANYLVGNSPYTAIIEIIGGSFECKALTDTCVGIVGTGSKVKVNNEIRPNHETINLNKNDTARIEGTGLTYLAIGGSFLAKSHFESVSTFPVARLGGLNGEVLKKGDKLSVSKGAENLRIKSLSEAIIPKALWQRIIRILKGPELETAGLNESNLEDQLWGISSQSNRMGIRLDGTPLKSNQKEISSTPTFPGTIQLTHEGLPIVLLNDGQTTGGYPRIGQVIKADLPGLARMLLGGSIKFKFVDISEARYILNQKETFLKHALD